MRVIQNGQLIDLEDSDCNDKGWMSGTGVFETIKTVENQPWAMSRHMRRAVSSAQQNGFRIPSEELIRSAVEELCRTEKHQQGLLRLSFGQNGKWSAVHLPYVPMSGGARLLTYDKVIAVQGQPVKSYPYSHRLEILEEIKILGGDEAIVCNDKEKVCEGSVTNLLLCIDDRWVTPPISDGVLPGIVRALVIEYCGVSVRSVDRSEIPLVRSAFLLSSLRIAQPVTSIDGRELEQSPDFMSEIEAMALRTSVG
jgi:branched-chain amino acid aminotransferase